MALAVCASPIRGRILTLSLKILPETQILLRVELLKQTTRLLTLRVLIST